MARINLPEKPTAEQFEKAEPLLLREILKDYYTEGNIKLADFRRVQPGQYTGEFRDGKKRFSFNINSDREVVTFKPINKSAIK